MAAFPGTMKRGWHRGSEVRITVSAHSSAFGDFANFGEAAEGVGIERGDSKNKAGPSGFHNDSGEVDPPIESMPRRKWG